MIKNYIIDTNVLVHDPYCISNFQDNNVIIPIMVV
ncbi:MAG: PIN domain-containing protein, partial [Pseudomonadota bacterium]